MGSEEQVRQLEALQVLRAALRQVTSAPGGLAPGSMEGLHIRLYHPDNCPLSTDGVLDDLDGGLGADVPRMLVRK